jgi:anti-sigma factor RsiW
VICADCERLIAQYLDGELDDRAAADVAEHIAACRNCGEHTARAEALSRLVRGAPYYVAPETLRTAVSSGVRRRHITPRLLAIAATVLLAVPAVALLAPTFRTTDDGRRTTDDGRRTAVAAEVVDQHVRALMSDRLYDVASTDQHTVKPWFLGKLDFSPPVVDLAAEGFPLQGGRVEYVEGRRVAALVYTRRKHAINVFVWPAADQDAAPSTETIRGFHVVHWTRGGMSFWAVSDLNEAELQEFVTLEK